MKRHTLSWCLIALALLASLLGGCGAPPTAPAPSPTVVAAPTAVPPTATPTIAPTGESREDGLSAEEAATLGSLERVDDYPLYTMRYYGAYDQRASSALCAKYR